MSYEQTNEFRKLQETSRMLSSREVRAYNSGSKVFNEGLRKYLTDVFRRQIKRSISGNAHSTRILNFENKEGITMNKKLKTDLITLNRRIQKWKSKH